MPSIGGLATISALNALENKIPNIRSLLKKKNKKKDYNTNITKIEKKNLLNMIMINILLLQNLII